MLYPAMKLKRSIDSEVDPGAEFLIHPGDIGFVSPLPEGGSRVYSSSIPDAEADGGVEINEPYIDVLASPSQISKGIQDAISGAAELQTMGAIRMNVKAQSELAGKPTIARGFNGG